MILNDLCFELVLEYNVTIGNGICDPILNRHECDWDGGDCISFHSNYPLCSAPIPSKIADGICDDIHPYNSEECGYDGGDCCKTNHDDPHESFIGILCSVAFIALICLFFARKYHQRRIQAVSDAAYLSNSRHSIGHLEEPESEDSILKRQEHIIGKILITQLDDDSKHSKSTARGSCSLDSSSSSSPSPPPLPEEVLDECCPICYQSFQWGDEVVRSLNKQCIHEYHKDCVLPWLLKSNECPMCRAMFIDSQADGEV